MPQLKKNKHYNTHLQRTWNKYGEDNFEHVIIEECDESLLEEREGYWIEHYESWHRSKGYNLTRFVQGRTIRYDQEKHDLIVKLFKEGKSKSGIAKELNTTRTMVYSCLEFHNLHKNIGAGKIVKLNDDIKNKVIDLRNDGKTWNEIYKSVPISKTQLRRTKTIVADGQYQSDKVNRKTYRTITDDIVKQALLLRNEGKTWEEIEIELGVSRFALHQNGVTKKSKPISKKGCKFKKIDKEIISKLKSEGKSVKEISLITGYAQSTIRLNLKKHNQA